MSKVVPYKQYTRNQRRAVLESDFSHGMMSTNGIVTEGYLKTLVNFTYEKDNGALIPRPSLRPYQIMFPDMSFDIQSDPDRDIWLSDGLTIKATKECFENGKQYNQIIMGKLDDNDDNVGTLEFITSEQPDSSSTVEINENYSYDIRYALSSYSDSARACFYSAELPQIHNVPLSKDPIKRSEFPVGTFAFGNSYYFLSPTGLQRTVFDTSVTPPRYKPEPVVPKDLSVIEAVSYGYNMLAGNGAYQFDDKHTARVLQFQGILPYDASGTTLLVTPKRNQQVLFRAYYDVELDRKFDIIWEWRETTSADWTLIQKEEGVILSATRVLECQFEPPAVDMMIRVSAYPYVDADGNALTEAYDTVEKAMVVGFDFSPDNHGAASMLNPEVYDLTTATGMEAWNGRIVLWGVPKDPTILFISDYNEPSYFPYPNNIVVFDEPIIYAVQFMDTLAVFTTDKLYQVTRNDDGNSWTSTVIQSHLSIAPWDKHLIQTVRNMLYFKSGNYYYMMVPKAQSLTGELTLAPITTPITSFFDNFSVNVETIIRETYDYIGDYELITYYNFLDYEDIHNIYLFTFDNSTSVMHFDVIYNTVDRTWKVWVYESSQMLFPFKPNATETGLLAASYLIDARSISDPSTEDPRRAILLFTWDKGSVKGSYLPNMTQLSYDPDRVDVITDESTVIIPAPLATVSGTTVIFGEEYADARDTTAILYGSEIYYAGFNIHDVEEALRQVYDEDKFIFKNYQFLDSGYRDDEVQANKRYRELQIHVNNLDKKNLQFGMEYILDGAPRRIFYKYDTSQMIDEFDPDYGVVYVDSTPFLEVDLKDIDITNQWTIDQSLTPDISLWKVRVAISGKGEAPRLKLLSRNEKRFELLSVNWVSRLMHMR